MARVSDARGRILAAALELFAAKGFAATTTAAIAHRAGVAEKTLFALFKTKEHLFEQTIHPAVIELAAPEAIAGLLRTIREPWRHFDEFLRAVAKNRIGFARKEASKVKLIVQELVLRPGLFDRFADRMGRDIVPRMMARLDQFVQAGELRELPPLSVVRIIASVLVGYLVARTIFRPDDPWDDDREIDIMVDVLVNGLSPREPTAKPPRKRR